MPRDKELRREEVRGVFVIGILTVLFAVSRLYGMPDLLIGVANLILPTWSVHVFLMAIGISEDLIRKTL